MKKRCPKCRRNFSIHLIHPINVNGEYFNVCPLCALKIRNIVAHLPIDTPFQGTDAKKLYKEALKEVGE